MAIVSAAGSHPQSNYVVVEVKSEDGIAGYGEATVVAPWSGETQDGAIHMIRNYLSPLLVGENALHLTALVDKMDRYLIGNPFTKCAVEMALIDLVGKALNIPAYTLLGGPRRDPKIRLRFSIGAFLPEKVSKIAERAIQLGLKSCKVKVGFDVQADIERVAAVRDVVGKNFRVGVDANGGWLENDAIRALPYLEKLEVNVLEQPLPRGDFRGCARIRQRTHIPLMLDESVFTCQQALEAVRQDAADIISIYPGKNGGMLRSMEIAQMLSTAGLRCTIGSNLEMDLGSAAMLHVAIAAPALDTTVDHDIIGPIYYDSKFTDQPIQYEEGYAVVPQGVGLGTNFKEPVQ